MKSNYIIITEFSTGGAEIHTTTEDNIRIAIINTVRCLSKYQLNSLTNIKILRGADIISLDKEN